MVNTSANIANLPLVLIVSDEAINVETLSFMLQEQQGIQSDSAIRAINALSLVKDCIKKNQMYKLVLLDYSMPQQDDGL